jgi:hypothetical protein
MTKRETASLFNVKEHDFLECVALLSDKTFF